MTKKKPRNLTRVSTYGVVSMSIMQCLPVFPSLVIACPSFPTRIPFAPGACWMPACLSTSLSKKNPVILHVHDFPSETVVFCFPLLFSKKEPIAGVIPSRVRRLKSGKAKKEESHCFPIGLFHFPLLPMQRNKTPRKRKKPRRCPYVGDIWRPKLSLAYLLSSLHLRTFSPPTKASPKIRKDSRLAF